MYMYIYTYTYTYVISLTFLYYNNIGDVGAVALPGALQVFSSNIYISLGDIRLWVGSSNSHLLSS